MTVRTIDRLLARLSNARHGNEAADLRDLTQSVFPFTAVDIGDRSGNITTSSMTNVDLTGISVAIPASTSDLLLISFACSTNNSDINGANIFAAAVAGTVILPTSVWSAPVASESMTFSLLSQRVVQAGDISGGNVTVSIKWRVTGGTGTVFNESTLDRAPVLWVQNVHRGAG